MTVDKLIKILEKLPKDKVVVITDPDGIGWDNVGSVEECESEVKIKADGNTLFDN